MAPDILLKHDYGKGVDIWSAGVVMYMLISGVHPFSYKSRSLDNELYCKLLRDQTPIEYNLENGFTK